MKRIIALLFVLCLLLCACGKNDTPETTAATEATVPPTTVAPTTEPETEPPTEATEPVVLMRHPLTGEVLDAPFSGRPVASTINNAPACLPQYGISQADWFFEIEVEGGVTRCLGIFTDPEDIGTIGPVRSARTYLISLAASFDAPLAHCGGSPWALEGQHAYDRYFNGYMDMDEMKYSSYYFRDTARQSQGYAFEHTLFTTGENLQKAMTDLGFDTPIEGDYGYTFAEQVNLKGDSAKDITISFLGTKTTKMHYNETAGAYEAAQRGGDWIDGATGEIVSFENVLVLFADQNKNVNGYHSFYDLYSGGTGYLAIDGQIVPIEWQREDVCHPFALFLKDGTPVTLKTGHTFAAVVSPSGSVTFG